MQMKTFKEWSSLGYRIKKGSRATWEDGIAKFSEKQVIERDIGHSPDLQIDEDFATCLGQWDWCL